MPMTAVDDAFANLTTQLNYINGLVAQIAAGTNVQGNIATLQGVMTDTMNAANAAASAAASAVGQCGASMTALQDSLGQQISGLTQQLTAAQQQLAACTAAPPQLPPASTTTPTTPTTTTPATPTPATPTTTTTTPKQGFSTGATAAIGVGAALVGFVAGRMTKK
jgi:hypothetical protein